MSEIGRRHVEGHRSSIVNESGNARHMNHAGHYVYKYVDSFLRSDVRLAFTIGEIKIFLDESFIKTPSNWQVAVVRSTITNLSLPIAIAPMLDDENTSWVLGLSYNGNLVTKNVKFISRLLVPDADQYIYYVRFGVYSIDHFIQMINTTYSELLQELKDDYSLPALVEPPILYYDDLTKLFGYKVQKQYYDQDGPTPVGVLYNYYYVAFIAKTDEENVGGQSIDSPQLRLIIRDTLGSNPDPSGDYYYPKQRISSLSNWEPVLNYQLETSLSIHPTYTLTSDNTTLNRRYVLKDYSPFDLTLEDAQRGSFTSETTELSYLELNGSGPIRDFNLYMVWTSKEGQTFPLTLIPNSGFDFRLVFRKRAHLED